MSRVPVSAVITTFNEREFIEDCIQSVTWADEIYVIDSFSTDGTVELIRQKFPSVRLDQREYFGAASQKNYGIDRAQFDWILFVDADELVTPELRDEVIRMLQSEPPHWGYSIGRRNFMLGGEVRYSGLQRDRVTRLFHRKHARYPNRRVHADLLVDGPVGRLQHKFDHFYIRSLDHMIGKMTQYANWGAAQKFIDGKTTSVAGIFGHSLAKFVRDYIINLGFLDGTRGLITVGVHVYYTFLKYSKLWEMNQLKRLGKPVPLPRLDESEERWELPWQKSVDSRVPSAETQPPLETRR